MVMLIYVGLRIVYSSYLPEQLIPEGADNRSMFSKTRIDGDFFTACSKYPVNVPLMLVCGSKKVGTVDDSKN